MNIEQHIAELEEQGFTLVPGLVDRDTTAAIRAFIDRTVAAGHVRQPEHSNGRILHRICHPIEDTSMALLACEPAILELATRSLRARNLRLRQQMFMLTLPCGKPPPASPDGWHVDTIFNNEEYRDTPSQTFI